MSAPTSKVLVLAGNGGEGFVDGEGENARFNHPSSVWMENSGNLLVSDCWNHAIRRVTPSGEVTTVVSREKGGTYVDYPTGIVEIEGKIVISSGHCLFDLTSKRKVVGTEDYLKPREHVNLTRGLRLHRGAIFAADAGDHTIKAVSLQGSAVLIAGVPGRRGGVDGHAMRAEFNSPSDLEVTEDGTIYVADSENNCVRRVRGGKVDTFVGVIGKQGYKDGRREEALFSFPKGLALDRLDNLLVAEFSREPSRCRVRRVTAEGLVTTLVELEEGPESISLPIGIVADHSAVYVAQTKAQRIVRVEYPSLWTREQHRHFPRPIRGRVAALVMLHRRDCAWGRLPRDLLFEIIPLVVRNCLSR